MKRIGVWVMCLSAGLFFGTLNAGATNMTLSGATATEDANPDQGYGGGRGSATYPHMFPGSVEGYSRPANNNEWLSITITQWNLPDSQGEAIDSVSSATASFVASWASYSGAYYFFRLTSGFEEDTVTWDTKPGIDTSAYVLWDPETAPANGSIVTFDVSSLLARNGNMTTFGIACIQVGGSAGGFLCQKESGAIPIPTLTAAYTVVPEPITLGFMGLGSVLLAARKKKVSCQTRFDI